MQWFGKGSNNVEDGRSSGGGRVALGGGLGIIVVILGLIFGQDLTGIVNQLPLTEQGEIKKGVKLEVQRDDKKIGDGKLINLQRNKKDVDRLIRGDECGILFEGSFKIEKGDIIVAYTEEKKRGEL